MSDIVWTWITTSLCVHTAFVHSSNLCPTQVKVKVKLRIFLSDPTFFLFNLIYFILLDTKNKKDKINKKSQELFTKKNPNKSTLDQNM